ncbi:hypothetical protein [Streptosporangium fragile]|uniref:hypothetical protein n=1 Tax=Streptosporangium fragile TaxID=46186 RepID=UPI0031E771F0
MIPEPGHVAIYRHGHHETRRRVIAWRDDHTPLVLSPFNTLEPARTLHGFDHIEDAPPPPATVLPGGGWLVTYTLDGETTHTTPIVAWHITPTGGHAIVTDEHGHLTNIDQLGPHRTVWHPDQQPSGPSEATP